MHHTAAGRTRRQGPFPGPAQRCWSGDEAFGFCFGFGFTGGLAFPPPPLTAASSSASFLASAEALACAARAEQCLAQAEADGLCEETINFNRGKLGVARGEKK